MSTNRIRVTSAEYELPTFAFYEFFADPTNLATDDVPASADVKAAAFSTEWLHTGLTAGSTWYYWVRTVRYNGLALTRSELLPIGAVVAGSIATAELADASVTYAKIQNVAGDRILGRNSGSSGVVQEVTCTSAGRALLAGANAAAQRTTLGAGAASGLATLDGSAYLTAGEFPAMTGDVTTAGGGLATTIGSNVVSFAKFQQISTARLLGRSTAGTGDVEQISIGSGLTLTGGVLDAAGGGGGGSGTVTSVAMTAPAFLSVSGSPITASGTLALSLATQSANLVFAGPSSGSAAAPTFRSLVGADLPNPSSSTLGGVQSKAAVSHQFLTSISTSGVPALAQPAMADISDYVTGTWTPVDMSGASLSFSGVVGFFTKTGREVTLYGRIQYPSTANGNTQSVGGVPYTPLSTNNSVGSCVNDKGYTLQTKIDAASGTMQFLEMATGGGHSNAGYSTGTFTFQLAHFT